MMYPAGHAQASLPPVPPPPPVLSVPPLVSGSAAAQNETSPTNAQFEAAFAGNGVQLQLHQQAMLLPPAAGAAVMAAAATAGSTTVEPTQNRPQPPGVAGTKRPRSEPSNDGEDGGCLLDIGAAAAAAVAAAAALAVEGSGTAASAHANASVSTVGETTTLISSNSSSYNTGGNVAKRSRDESWLSADAPSISANVLATAAAAAATRDQLHHRAELRRQAEAIAAMQGAVAAQPRSAHGLQQQHSHPEGEDALGDSEQGRMKCPFCARSFQQENGLMRHLRMHTGERPHVCKECNKSFSQKSDLNRHMRMHMPASERPFVCPVCKRGFTRSDNLKEHLRVHTGEKPFGCTRCRRRFRHKSTLTNHVCHHKT